MRTYLVVENFEHACKELAFVGSAHPEDRPSIIDEHAQSEAALVGEIAKLRRKLREAEAIIARSIQL